MFRNTPPITKNLLIITFVVYLAQLVFERSGIDLAQVLGLHFFLADDFRIWQLVTYMFLHGSFEHILMNMFSFWMFARIVEQSLGSKRFVYFYLICGIGAGLCQELWQLGEYLILDYGSYSMVSFEDGMTMPMASFLNMQVTVGASGAVYGILLAFGMLFPNERIMLLFPPIPMKAKYFVAGFAVIELLASFSSNSNVAHFAHLGGMFFAWMLFLYWKKQDSKRSMGSFTTWNNYQPRQPRENLSIMERIRRFFGINRKDDGGLNDGRWYQASSARTSHQSDYDYNARKKANEDRIDEILDKIKASGYQSLTEEEKKELFDRTRR